jgi:hypothetical protein
MENLIIGVLENIANDPGNLGFGMVPGVFTADDHIPPGGTEQAVAELDQGGFPGAVLPYQGDIFTPFNVQIDGIHRQETIGVFETDVFKG